jgi:hypothetical protein
LIQGNVEGIWVAARFAGTAPNRFPRKLAVVAGQIDWQVCGNKMLFA